MPDSLTRPLAAALAAAALSACASPTERSHTIASCVVIGDSAKRMICVTTRAHARAKSSGIVASINAVERAAGRDARIAAICHQAMHELARRSKAPGEQVMGQLPRIRGACASGYVHGVFEQVAKDALSGQVTALARDCRRYQRKPGRDHLAARECFHGLGHGLRRRKSSGDAGEPGSAMYSAIRACRAIAAAMASATTSRPHIAPQPGPYSKCLGGAFMEDRFVNGRQLLPIPDEAATCPHDDPPAVAAACRAFAVALAGRWEYVLGWCEADSRERVQSLCLMSYGRSLPPSTSAPCAQLLADVSYRACIAGFLRGNIHEAQLLEVGAGARTCASAALDQRPSCAEELGRLTAVLDHDAPCVFADRQLADACAAGKRDPAPDSMSPAVI